MASSLQLRASKLFDLTSKVALVTGGGTGIGLMAAQTLAAQGARVYIAGRRLEVLKKTAETHGSKEALGGSGGSLVPIECDITKKESLKRMVEEIKKNGDKVLHVLVNSSGIAGGHVDTSKGDESVSELAKDLMSDEEGMWEDTYRTNVMGHYFTSAACLELLNGASEGTHGWSGGIINITSISGITSNAQNHFAYNVSKGAAIHLTNLMAKEFARDGVKVRVNSIAPGYFPSEMTTKESDSSNKSSLPAGSSYGKEKGVPAGRPGRDEDMAQAVLFLASCQYVNGQNIPVDGGFLLAHPS